MVNKIIKNSVSNYPVPTLNCTCLCFLNEADMDDNNKAVYWIPFSINLVENHDKTPEEIDNMVQALGTEKFNDPSMAEIFQGIELGASLNI